MDQASESGGPQPCPARQRGGRRGSGAWLGQGVGRGLRGPCGRWRPAHPAGLAGEPPAEGTG
eukprot:11271217-Alexandrium_andersonii.AAC.1